MPTVPVLSSTKKKKNHALKKEFSEVFSLDTEVTNHLPHSINQRLRFSHIIYFLLYCLEILSFFLSVCLYIYIYDASDKIKPDFFQAVTVSILLYRCSTLTLTKCMNEKLDGNYTRMLCTVLNKSQKQHLTKLYAHLPPISKTALLRRIKHVGLGRRNKDELISDVLLWTPYT